MTYPEAETYLNTLPMFAMKGAVAYAPGLNRIRAVLEAMGQPHLTYPIVHIAGTNGKGSTASFLAAIATASGAKTGLHTSPHLRHVAERMRVNGVPAPAAWIAASVSQYKDVFTKKRVSFFEATVALSLLYFAHQAVDLAIVEVGLGGRLDATNIVSPALVIITSIGLDHTHILGNSIRDITREKAGIIKAGVPVLSAVTQQDAIQEIKAAAAQKAAPFILLDDVIHWSVLEETPTGLSIKAVTSLQEYPALKIGLLGLHQSRNALLALLAAEILFADVDQLAQFIGAGLAQVVALSGLRGRMEVVYKEPLIILDVGHNQDGLHAALTSMSAMLMKNQGQLFVMFGTMGDKDIVEMAKQLSTAGARVFAPPIIAERALSSKELVQMLRAQNIKATRVSSFEEGLSQFHKEATSRDGLLIVGSHFLAAQYLRMIDS